MKFRHKPTIIEVEPFIPGKEDGILCTVRDRKNTRTEEVFFAHKKNEDTQHRIKASRYSSYVVVQRPAILIDGKPVPIKEDDFIQTVPSHEIVTLEEIAENYDQIKDRRRGQQDEEAAAAGGSNQTEDSSQLEVGKVRQGGESETELDNAESADGE